MKIGFLGLGRMGSVMAGNLTGAGHELVAWNRSSAAAEALAQTGIRVASSIEEAVDADAIVSMLADDVAVDSVAFGDEGFLAGPARLHVSMSTISLALVDRLDAAHRDHGSTLVSAPVFGRPEAARERKLGIVAAGPAAAIDACRPLFASLGDRIFVVGEKPSQANLVKLCGNFMVAAAIEALAEAIALAERGGIAAGPVVDVVASMLFPGPVHRTYGRMMQERRFFPAGFTAALGLKDVELVASVARDLQAPMPSLDPIHRRLLSLIAEEGGSIDWGAVLLQAERAADSSATMARST